LGSTAIANYKNGRIPKSDELFRLSRELGVTMEYLLTGKEVRTNHERETSVSQTGKVHDVELPYPTTRRERRIPVVGWAHAGEAADYEELPASWQDRIPTDCRDERAFGVRLEGESMMPDFKDGDLLVLMPSEEVYSGALAVVRLEAGGVLFRRVEIRAERLVLVPLNPQYDREEFKRSEVSWCYPVWGSWRQTWK
jgi:SOS-response transcriptional repressor LexA